VVFIAPSPASAASFVLASSYRPTRQRVRCRRGRRRGTPVVRDSSSRSLEPSLRGCQPTERTDLGPHPGTVPAPSTLASCSDRQSFRDGPWLHLRRNNAMSGPAERLEGGGRSRVPDAGICRRRVRIGDLPRCACRNHRPGRTPGVRRGHMLGKCALRIVRADKHSSEAEQLLRVLLVHLSIPRVHHHLYMTHGMARLGDTSPRNLSPGMRRSTGGTHRRT
jgi:hypothetical protein